MLRNFIHIIELLDIPHICAWVMFKPIPYDNKIKYWNYFDKHSLFDYIFIGL